MTALLSRLHHVAIPPMFAKLSIFQFFEFLELLRFCCCCFYKSESCEYLSLELITLAVRSVEAETVRGVRVTVSGTCQVKVDAYTGEDLEQNIPQITLACQHILGKVSQ